MAEKLAAREYAPPGTPVPDFLKALSQEQWRSLRYLPERNDLWNDADPLFRPRFLLPGFIFDQIAAVNIVDAEGARPVPFSTDFFAVPDESLAARIARERLGFGGLTLGGAENAAATGLIGTSHFQFRGRNGSYGVFARPVAIDTATPAGEQFPCFRELWLLKPEVGATEITVYALMDAPAMTGAFRMTFRPGTSAVLDVHARLFPRAGAPKAKTGIAPVAGMFLFSETRGRPANDYRPEAHNCDGLLIAGPEGDWHWTPLQNPERLTIRARRMTNPRGFGLLQRDAVFDHYQDLARRYDRSPSVWVEPVGDWGAGGVELVEIPGTKDHHSNIVAYWVPEEPAAGPFAVDYRVYWMPPGARLHELGEARDTRLARSAEDGTVTFVVDFEGGELNGIPADTGLTSVVAGPEEAPLVDKRLMKNDVTGGWRLTMRFKLPEAGMLDSLLAARDGSPRLVFSAHLKRGENLVEPLTETWRYSLTQ